MDQPPAMPGSSQSSWHTPVQGPAEGEGFWDSEHEGSDIPPPAPCR